MCVTLLCIYRGADKSLARPTSRCILFDGENISFDVSFVIYINSTNIFEMWCWRRMEKISWTDRVRNEEVLLRVNEQRNILHEIRKWKAN